MLRLRRIFFLAMLTFISLAFGCGKAYLMLACACITSWTFHHTGIISQTPMNFATPRKERIVRNHIGCAMLVWVRLKEVAFETQRTVYQVKHDLLSDYLRQQLKSPTVQMRLA